MQLVPWAVLGVLGVATAALLLRPTFITVRVTQVVAALSFPAALYGVIEHVIANHNAGPLDAVYSAKWDTMTALSQWWAAATKAVGPSPTLTPAVMAQVGLCLGLATIAHPALRG